MNKLQYYWKQLLAVMTATLGSVSSGMEFSWTSPAVPILTSNTTHIFVTEDDIYWLETLYMLGGLCTLPVTFTILHFLGRKKSIMLSGGISFVCWILLATADSVTQLFVARFISGMGCYLAFGAIPIYIAEITEPKVRGFFGALVHIMTLVGLLITYGTVPYIPIYAFALLGALVSFLQLVTFAWQPESPYYLLTKSKRAESKYMLSKLRCSKRNTDEELELICKAVERQSSERGRLIDLILISSNRKASLIIIVLDVVQNMLGATVMPMNVHTILQKSGAAAASKYAANLFGVMMLVSSIIGSILIDKYGRKFLLITSFLLTSFCFGILGGYFIIQDVQNTDMFEFQWVPPVAIIAYAFAFKFGAGLVPVVVPAELLPTSVKSKGITGSNFCFTLSAIAAIKIYFISVENYGMYFPFLLFSLSGVLAAIFIYFYMPETKGKTLEEIQMILKNKSEVTDLNHFIACETC